VSTRAVVAMLNKSDFKTYTTHFVPLFIYIVDTYTHIHMYTYKGCQINFDSKFAFA